MTRGRRRVTLMSARQFPPTRSRQCELSKCSCLQEMVTSASEAQMAKWTIAARVWKPLSNYCLDPEVAMDTSVCEMKSFYYRPRNVIPTLRVTKPADTERSRVTVCTRHRCSTMRQIDGIDKSVSMFQSPQQHLGPVESCVVDSSRTAISPCRSGHEIPNLHSHLGDQEALKADFSSEGRLLV